MKILIIDDEFEICDIMTFLIMDLFPGENEILSAQSGNSAIEILKKNEDIDLCICDHHMPDGMGPDVLKYLIHSKSKTKFVLCSTTTPKDRPEEYPANFVFFNIQKPNVAAGLEKLSQLIEKDTPEKIRLSKEDFVPVTIRLLSLMGKAPADIYIRVSDEKYLKCINQFEIFGMDDKEKYAQKQIDVLHIKKGDQIPTVREIVLETVTSIMERRNLPLSEKMIIAHSQLVELIKFTGMSPELAEVTKKNIQQTTCLLMKSPPAMDFWKGLNLLGEYPSNLYTLHSMLASVVVKKLSWNSEATMYKLTLSAFLQDVSLDSIPLMEIIDYREFLVKENTFTRAEIKKFNEHPFKATELIASFKEIPPDIDRLLMEQHEMPDGTGFPRKLNANQMGPLSCVFIITAILAKCVIKKGTSFDVGSFAAEMEARGYSRGNFKEAFEVIKAMDKPRS